MSHSINISHPTNSILNNSFKNGIYVYNTSNQWDFQENILHKLYIEQPIVDNFWEAEKLYNVGDCVKYDAGAVIKYYACTTSHYSKSTDLVDNSLNSNLWFDYTHLFEEIHDGDYISTYKSIFNHCSSSEFFSVSDWVNKSIDIIERTQDQKLVFPNTNSTLLQIKTSKNKKTSDYYLKYMAFNEYGKHMVCSIFVKPGTTQYLSLSLFSVKLQKGYSVIFDLTTSDRVQYVSDSYITTEYTPTSANGIDTDYSSYGITEYMIGGEKYYRLWISAKFLSTNANFFQVNLMGADKENNPLYSFKATPESGTNTVYINSAQVEFHPEIVVSGTDLVSDKISPSEYIKTTRQGREIFVVNKLFRKYGGVIQEYNAPSNQQRAPQIYYFKDEIPESDDYQHLDLAIRTNYVSIKKKISPTENILCGVKLGDITFPTNREDYVWTEPDTIGQVAFENSTRAYYIHLDNKDYNTAKFKSTSVSYTVKSILNALIFNANQYTFYNKPRGDVSHEIGINGGGCYTPKVFK